DNRSLPLKSTNTSKHKRTSRLRNVPGQKSRQSRAPINTRRHPRTTRKHRAHANPNLSSNTTRKPGTQRRTIQKTHSTRESTKRKKLRPLPTPKRTESRLPRDFFLGTKDTRSTTPQRLSALKRTIVPWNQARYTLQIRVSSRYRTLRALRTRLHQKGHRHFTMTRIRWRGKKRYRLTLGHFRTPKSARAYARYLRRREGLSPRLIKR
ncbi:MAG: SPOR domain-containing protein, partial [Myxococcota bacterium]